MVASEDKVRQFFDHVVVKYNCGDIQKLLEAKLDKAGPLLCSVVNGIDIVGGMAHDFTNNSKFRSVEFMKQHFGLTHDLAILMYSLVRCGIAHEGVTKTAIHFFVEYDLERTGKYLLKDAENAIYLHVVELAHVYLNAIEHISADVYTHLKYVPTPRPEEEALFGNSLAAIPDLIYDLCNELAERGREPMSSCSPFLPEWLDQYVVNNPD